MLPFLCRVVEVEGLVKIPPDNDEYPVQAHRYWALGSIRRNNKIVKLLFQYKNQRGHGGILAGQMIYRWKKEMMRIISIIEDQEVINKILLHLGLWQTKQRPPPKPKSLEIQIDYSDSQLSFYEDAPDQDFEVSADHPTL
jgi:hypothetical protein